jgi:hypothetical protein
MHQLSVGDHRYHLVIAVHNGEWTAHARRADTGDRFGIEFSEGSESAVFERLKAWLLWQHEHADALKALQRAEHAYHRMIAGSAFANPTEGPTPIELQRESLDAVEAARLRLDDVRARKPD